MHHRFSFVLASCVVALVCFHASVFAERPNIVFIFSDDHATQAISAYGSRINETPHIDRIAREGGVFFNSFCANSICGPSRACILTGKHSHLNGFLRNGNRFDSKTVDVSTRAATGGLSNGHVGQVAPQQRPCWV